MLGAFGQALTFAPQISVTIVPISEGSVHTAYSWFVSDVTAAMLVGKNNNLSLRWELNFIIMQILRKKKIVLCYQPTWPP